MNDPASPDVPLSEGRSPFAGDSVSPTETPKIEPKARSKRKPGELGSPFSPQKAQDLENEEREVAAPPAKPRYECSGCKKVFASGRILGGHRRHCQTEDELRLRNKKSAFECPVCKKVFASGPILGGHRRHCQTEDEVKLRNEKRSLEDLSCRKRKHKCPFCKKVFTRSEGSGGHRSRRKTEDEVEVKNAKRALEALSGRKPGRRSKKGSRDEVIIQWSECGRPFLPDEARGNSMEGKNPFSSRDEKSRFVHIPDWNLPLNSDEECSTSTYYGGKLNLGTPSRSV